MFNFGVTLEIKVSTPAELFDALKYNGIDIMLFLDKPYVAKAGGCIAGC